MKGLIATVGGSPEPLIEGIREAEPGFVCFYCHQDQIETVKEAKKGLGFEGFEALEVVVEDPQDFKGCFEKANESVEELTRRNIYPNDTLLDYTGGTKIMSSALVAATLGRGFQYVLVATSLDQGLQYMYMGEGDDDRDGLNYIEDGMKEVLSSKNPWEIRAMESKRKIQRNFNNYRFKPVIDQVDSLKEKGLSSERDGYLLDAIRELARGYSRWDRFHYEEVKKKLREGEEDLRTYKDLAQPRGQLDLSEEKIEENIGFLSDLQSETFGFDFEKRIGKSLAVDMFWNATRRAEEGKYDDGIVRLYRTVEMLGQVEIYDELGHHTDEVPVELIPEKLRDDLRKKSDEKEKVELGLNDNFRVLSALGNEIGESFLAHENDFKKIMRTRNTSFLTHNFKSIEKHQFDSQRKIVEDIFEIKRRIDFPKLEIIQ